MDAVKIVNLELENVKRVRAVSLHPDKDGLTVIGGGNREGKTSILDAIAYGLGGEKYRPTTLQRIGGAAEARIDITLSNGLRVTRSGKNASLKVIDPAGRKGGQKLLDSFIDELAINLPKFLAMSSKDKAAVLLKILGIGDQLTALDAEERKAYEERTIAGRIADQKTKFAAECPEHHDVGETPITAAELIVETQAVMRRNAQREIDRRNIVVLKTKMESCSSEIEKTQAEIKKLGERLYDLDEEWKHLNADYQAVALAPPEENESTAEIEKRIAEVENENAKIRANLDKRKAVEDADQHSLKVAVLTEAVEAVRSRRKALLDGAPMPLPGLTIVDGELAYDGKAWDCMSGVERVRAAVAIVRKLKPSCGFVLLDELEKFDLEELKNLSAWLEQEGLQAIATRVSTGDECSIIIEDGMVAGQAAIPEEEATQEDTEADW